MHQCEQRVPARKLCRDIGQTSNARPSSTIGCPVGTFSSSDRAADRVASSGQGNPSPISRHSTTAQVPEFSDHPPIIRIATGWRIEAARHGEDDVLHHKARLVLRAGDV